MIISQGKRKSIDYTVLFGWFLIYSFIGWVYETMYCSFKAGHYVSRGFLFGPFIPIYGLCIVSAILLLSGKGLGKITLFISSACIATVFEYITSLWMEFVFGRRWWDYSHNPFNIEGRICLGSALAFGFSGLIIIKYLHPNIVRVLNEYLPSGMMKKTTIFVLLIFILDVFASFLRAG